MNIDTTTASMTVLRSAAKGLGIKGFSRATKAQRAELVAAIDAALAPEPAPKASEMPSERKLANAIARCSSAERAELREDLGVDMPANARKAKLCTAIAKAVAESGAVPDVVRAHLRTKRRKAPKGTGSGGVRGKVAEALSLMASLDNPVTRKAFSAALSSRGLEWGSITGPLRGLVKAGFATQSGERGSYSWTLTEEGRAAAAAAA